jgi:hypothetical protein
MKLAKCPVEDLPGNTAMTPLASTTRQPQPAYEGDVGGAGRRPVKCEPSMAVLAAIMWWANVIVCAACLFHYAT